MIKKLLLFSLLAVAGVHAMDVFVEGDGGARRIIIYSVETLETGVQSDPSREAGVDGLERLLRCAQAKQWKVTPTCTIPSNAVTVGLLAPIWLCICSMEEKFGAQSPYVATLKAWCMRLEQWRKNEKRQLRRRAKLEKALANHANAAAMKRKVIARINTPNALADDQDRLNNLDSALNGFAEQIIRWGGQAPHQEEDSDLSSDGGGDTDEEDDLSVAEPLSGSPLPGQHGFLMPGSEDDFDDEPLPELGSGISPNFCQPTPQPLNPCPPTPRKPKTPVSARRG